MTTYKYQSMKYRRERAKMNRLHKKDREKVWDAIKGRRMITTRRAAQLSGFKSVHYVAFRLKELVKEGKMKWIKKSHAGSLWEILV